MDRVTMYIGDEYFVRNKDDRSFKDFACKCTHKSCRMLLLNKKAVQKFTFFTEKLRQLGIEIKITSAHRCWLHNKNVGGAKDSKHIRGKAFDVTPAYKNFTPYTLTTILQVAREYFSYCYHNEQKGFVHMDDR